MPKEVADYPKQSDRALHRCLYNRKSVKNDCASNCLAFTYKNRAREKRDGVTREDIITVNKSNSKLRASDSELVPSP